MAYCVGAQSGGKVKNILIKWNRFIGTQKLIPRSIKHLEPYKSEAANIFLKSLLRTNKLYGAETMFNLTKN